MTNNTSNKKLKPNVGFIGLTHLGIVYSTAFSAKDINTICFDLNPNLTNEINNNILPINEPGILEQINLNKINKTQIFTSEINELNSCDIVYISCDVITDDDGNSDLTIVNKLVELVSNNLSEHCVLVILCQVPPGYTRSLNVTQYEVYYQVETLVFGEALNRALTPERYIIGCNNPKEPLNKNLDIILSAFDCPILKMKYESAELAKISINVCLVASVTTANTLAEISECIDADWSEIVPALKLDKRIGKYSYLKPGLGISGGNLERDLATLVQISDKNTLDASFIKSCIHNSKNRANWVFETLKSQLINIKSSVEITILGLAYKENTHSIKNSPSISLLNKLKDLNQDLKVKVHDPVVDPKVVSFAKSFESELDALKDSNILIIMTPWAQYRNLKLSDIVKFMNVKLIIDPFAVIDFENINSTYDINHDFKYFTLGKKPITIANKEEVYA